VNFERERQNVGQGWQVLLENLHENLLSTIGEHHVVQIKEKFGGLRYYYMYGHGGQDELDMQTARALVRQTENLSFEICVRKVM